MNHFFPSDTTLLPTVASLPRSCSLVHCPYSLRFSLQFSLVIRLCRPTELAGSPWTSVSSSIKLDGWPRLFLKSLSVLTVYGPQFTVYNPPPHPTAPVRWSFEPPPLSSLRAWPVCVRVKGGREAGRRWGWVYVSKGPCGLECGHGWSYRTLQFQLLSPQKMKLLYSMVYDFIFSNKIPHKSCKDNLHTFKVTHWFVTSDSSADQKWWAQPCPSVLYVTSVPTNCLHS